MRAASIAREILLRECARPGGPRGEGGKCPADDEAELAIRDVLLAAYPRWGFLGEETGAAEARPGQGHVWCVDPNDGTSSMQRGYRGHAISIGLVHGGLPVLGVVCAVDAPDDDGDLICWAEGCGPIRRNGVAVSGRTWSNRLCSDDVVGVSQGANRNPLGYVGCVAPARYLGTPSIAYRLALVACGDHEATLSLNHLRAWDFAAGHALIRAAGGVAVDERGQVITYPTNGASPATRLFAGSHDVVEDLRRRQWESVSRSGFGQTAPPPELYPARPQPGRLIHDAAALRRAQGCLLGQIAGDSAAGQPGPHAELALVLARRLVLDGDCRVDSAAAGYAAWRNGWTHSLEPLACDHAWCLPPDASLVDEHASDDAGALMRVSPLGIWGAFRHSAHVAQAARRDAALTHPSPLAQAASAVFAVTLAAAIREGLDPPRTLAFALSWASDQRLDERIVGALQHARHAPPSGPASVLTSLQHAFFQLLHTTTFADPASGALLGAVHGREAIPGQLQRMVLSSRPLYGQPGVQRPRPAVYWPTDALVLAERLLASGR